MASQLGLSRNMQKGFTVRRISSRISSRSTVLSPEMEATASFSIESSSTSLDDMLDEFSAEYDGDGRPNPVMTAVGGSFRPSLNRCLWRIGCRCQQKKYINNLFEL